jgi:hypothetical protein
MACTKSDLKDHVAFLGMQLSGSGVAMAPLETAGEEIVPSAQAVV